MGRHREPSNFVICCHLGSKMHYLTKTCKWANDLTHAVILKNYSIADVWFTEVTTENKGDVVGIPMQIMRTTDERVTGRK